MPVESSATMGYSARILSQEEKNLRQQKYYENSMGDSRDLSDAVRKTQEQFANLKEETLLKYVGSTVLLNVLELTGIQIP